MVDDIHRTSLSAWQALSKVGGLELNDRDCDLAAQLKVELDPQASTLEDALTSATTDIFLQALFRLIQPFSMMFRDVLEFFKKAGARDGQLQWKVSVDDQILELQHFEDFLTHWNAIDCELNIPNIDYHGAFILHHAIQELGTHKCLLQEGYRKGKIVLGQDEVDNWLSEFNRGHYLPFPQYLDPIKLGCGLDDAARIAMAALGIIRSRGLTTAQLRAGLASGEFTCVEEDALHFGTIAQNETDFWLPFTITCLTTFLLGSDQDRKTLGNILERKYSKFPRRRIGAKAEVSTMERLLSLPAWRKRYELYGVWIATDIVQALKGHKVIINHDKGELKFAFNEARIADVNTASPKVSLFSERRTCLVNPVGKGRNSAVQPDFGLWTSNLPKDHCVLVVEVKHYKRRNRGNFRNALIDYANAHPRAEVLLVNYGPVGPEFDDLPNNLARRCKMIGNLTPEHRLARADFRKIVRGLVGRPFCPRFDMERDNFGGLIVIDTSSSMQTVLSGQWFRDFISELERRDQDVVMVDNTIRAQLKSDEVQDWLSKNRLGFPTHLTTPVKRLLSDHELVSVVTDLEGCQNLRSLQNKVYRKELASDCEVQFLQFFRTDADD